MKDTGVKGLCNYPLSLRKAIEARHIVQEALKRGPERPLCEAVKTKPECAKRPQDARRSRGIWCLMRAEQREWSQPKREKSAVVIKV